MADYHSFTSSFIQLDPIERCEKVVAVTEELMPRIPIPLDARAIMEGNSDANLALLCRLFLTHQHLAPPSIGESKNDVFSWMPLFQNKAAEWTEHLHKTKEVDIEKYGTSACISF